MTSSPLPDPDDALASDTDLALSALDALDDTEQRTVETVLATDAAAASTEARLRRAAGTMAASAAGIDAAPALDLRDRVIAAARAERAPTVLDLDPTVPAELHRIQGELLVSLLETLSPAEWSTSVDPPEFAGWTVGDLVAHLATVEAYLGQQLGAALPPVPERDPVNEDRTRAAIARHRQLTPARAIAELESCLAAVDDDIASRDDPAERPVTWWGNDTTVDRVLVIRSFELWTHAADIARAVGRPEPVPSAPSLRTMTDLATALTPVMCAASGALPDPVADRWVRFDLTGPGGAAHDIALDAAATHPATGEPTVTLTLDVIDYCRAVANRVPAGRLACEHRGDADLATAVITSLPALATL